LTIPNFITVGRFLLVPLVIYALLDAQAGLAFAGFLIAGISDGVDGFIARHFNQRSDLGAYLDPVADKVLLVSVFIVLGYLGQLPLWLVIAAVSRDALIVSGVLLANLMGMPVKIDPLYISKANTAVQIALAATVLAVQAFQLNLGPVLPILIYLSGLLTVASAAAYLVAWLRHMSGNGEDKTPQR
jgi:cardiolipin synthase